MKKLSLRMKEALDNLQANGRFQLEEMSDRLFWRPVNNVTGKHIRTDTMDALEKRNLVKTLYVREDKKWRRYAELIKSQTGEEAFAELIKSQTGGRGIYMPHKKQIQSFNSLDEAKDTAIKEDREFSIYKDEQDNFYIYHEGDPIPPGQWLFDFIYLDGKWIHLEIGQLIKSLRKKHKLTQETLALKANISRSYISGIENNKYNPSLSILKNIVSALNFFISALQ